MLLGPFGDAHSNLPLWSALLNILLLTGGVFWLNAFLPETQETHPSPQHTFPSNFTSGASQSFTVKGQIVNISDLASQSRAASPELLS